MKMLLASADRFAFAAAMLFAVALALSIGLHPSGSFSGPPPLSVILTVSAFILFHLATLPVIAALEAPEWARGSGYVWVAVDNMLEMLALFGEGAELVTPLRWGIHLALAVWLFGVGISARGLVAWGALTTALVLTAITLAGPFLEREAVTQTLGPAAMLMIIWLLIAGYTMNKRSHPST